MIIAVTDPNWEQVIRVSDINPDDCTCVTHDSDGNAIKVGLPEVLFKAMVAFGEKKGEQKFIDQDIERSEWDPNRPD